MVVEIVLNMECKPQLVETLTVVHPYSNIIVLTDAPAKDDGLKSVIIGLAEKKANSIHFL